MAKSSAGRASNYRPKINTPTRTRVPSSQAARMKNQFKPQTRPSLNRVQGSSQNKLKPSLPIKPQFKPQTKPQFKPQSKPGVKPQPRPQLQPGKKPLFKPNLKPQVKPNLQSLGFPQLKPNLNAFGGQGKMAAGVQAKNAKKAALGLLWGIHHHHCHNNWFHPWYGGWGHHCNHWGCGGHCNHVWNPWFNNCGWNDYYSAPPVVVVEQPIVQETVIVEAADPVAEPAPAPIAEPAAELAPIEMTAAAGGSITIPMEALGADEGQVMMQVGPISLPTRVTSWKDNQIELQLPYIGVAGSTRAQLHVFKADRELLRSIEIELTQPAPPAQAAK